MWRTGEECSGRFSTGSTCLGDCRKLDSTTERSRSRHKLLNYQCIGFLGQWCRSQAAGAVSSLSVLGALPPWQEVSRDGALAFICGQHAMCAFHVKAVFCIFLFLCITARASHPLPLASGGPVASSHPSSRDFAGVHAPRKWRDVPKSTLHTIHFLSNIFVDISHSPLNFSPLSVLHMCRCLWSHWLHGKACPNLSRETVQKQCNFVERSCTKKHTFVHLCGMACCGPSVQACIGRLNCLGNPPGLLCDAIWQPHLSRHTSPISDSLQYLLQQSQPSHPSTTEAELSQACKRFQWNEKIHLQREPSGGHSAGQRPVLAAACGRTAASAPQCPPQSATACSWGTFQPAPREGRSALQTGWRHPSQSSALRLPMLWRPRLQHSKSGAFNSHKKYLPSGAAWAHEHSCCLGAQMGRSTPAGLIRAAHNMSDSLPIGWLQMHVVEESHVIQRGSESYLLWMWPSPAHQWALGCGRWHGRWCEQSPAATN